MKIRFQHRREAGELLAKKLALHPHRKNAVVMALPRGGVPVGFAMAERLELELDVLQVRKLGIPGNESLVMGAVSENGVCVLRPEIVGALDIPPEAIEAAAQREQRTMKRRARLYHASRPEISLAGRTAIVVDDGLITGATMQAAVRDLRHRHPAQIIVALPVATPRNIEELRPEVDEIVSLMVPDWLTAIQECYVDFAEVEDEEVRKCLVEAAQWRARDALAMGLRERPASHPTVPR